MLLQRLVEYADRAGLPPSGFINADVHWVVSISLDGTPENIVSLWREEDSGKGKKKRRGVSMLVPSIRRSSDAEEMPALLVDRPVYVLGERFENSPNASKYRESFVKLVQECARKTQLAEVGAVCRFYEKHFNTIVIPDDIRPTDKVTFRVGSTYPIELPAVREFWGEKFVAMRRLYGDENSPVVQMCLVCGE
ncbi:MAG: type I-C CRISPR-associated protein Cas8c/Csd1, partial [Fimbriimonadales bacterium]|nr:type I-C CRISPR-associated protein Cas8c/Csd1 [Fimbriimonadales bacterium]